MILFQFIEVGHNIHYLSLLFQIPESSMFRSGNTFEKMFIAEIQFLNSDTMEKRREEDFLEWLSDILFHWDATPKIPLMKKIKRESFGVYFTLKSHSKNAKIV